MAQSVGRFVLENSQASGSQLPESDAADMDIFLSRMEQLLPILDHEFSSPSAAAVIHGGQANGLTSWKNSKGVFRKEKEEQDIQQDGAAEA